MARGFSKVILVGNLTRDPELRATGGGKQVCSFSIAVNRGTGDQGSVSYFDCTAWERIAEVICQYAHKGSGVLVSGRLEQRSWEQDGQKRSRVEVVVEDFQFIGGFGEGGAPAAPQGSTKSSSDDITPEDIGDDPIDLSEIPF